MQVSLLQALSLLPDNEPFVCFTTRNRKRVAHKTSMPLDRVVSALEGRNVHRLTKRSGPVGYHICVDWLLIKLDRTKTKAYLKLNNRKFVPKPKLRLKAERRTA